MQPILTDSTALSETSLSDWKRSVSKTICILVLFFGAGGGEKVGVKLANSYASVGVNVDLVVSSRTETYPTYRLNRCKSYRSERIPCQVLDFFLEKIFQAQKAAMDSLGDTSNEFIFRIEGFWFGLRTIICKLPGWENVKGMVEAGLFKLASNSDEVVSTVLSDGETRLDVSQIFRPNGLENMLLGIDSIIRTKKPGRFGQEGE